MKLEQIIELMDQKHDAGVKISDIADELGYNVDYMSRCFKKCMGITMMEYLYELRVKGIYEDLTGTDLSIHEIYERHGCSNYRIAIRKFKKKYGAVPSRIRRECR